MNTEDPQELWRVYEAVSTVAPQLRGCSDLVVKEAAQIALEVLEGEYLDTDTTYMKH